MYVLGGIVTDNKAFLSIKCLFASFRSLSLMLNNQNYLKPLILLYGQNQIVFKVPNFDLILILYRTITNVNQISLLSLTLQGLRIV